MVGDRTGMGKVLVAQKFLWGLVLASTGDLREGRNQDSIFDATVDILVSGSELKVRIYRSITVSHARRIPLWSR